MDVLQLIIEIFVETISTYTMAGLIIGASLSSLWSQVARSKPQEWFIYLLKGYVVFLYLIGIVSDKDTWSIHMSGVTLWLGWEFLLIYGHGQSYIMIWVDTCLPINQPVPTMSWLLKKKKKNVMCLPSILTSVHP